MKSQLNRTKRKRRREERDGEKRRFRRAWKQALKEDPDAPPPEFHPLKTENYDHRPNKEVGSKKYRWCGRCRCYHHANEHITPTN